MHFCSVCVCLQINPTPVASVVSHLFKLASQSVAGPLLLPHERVIKSPAIHAERIEILDFSLFFPLPNESVAKQSLSGSARDHGIWYQSPFYLCEQPPKSNFHGV